MDIMETDLDEADDDDDEKQPLNSPSPANSDGGGQNSLSTTSNGHGHFKGSSPESDRDQHGSNLFHTSLGSKLSRQSPVNASATATPNPLRSETIEELTTAIRKGNASLVEECLHDCHELIDVCDSKGMTLLLLASEISDPECVRVLLENGSDVQHVDTMGRGGLHWVLDVGCHCEICSNKNVKCLELLFQYGANPNAEDYNGETPLHFAAKNMLPKCAQVLLDNGADIDHVSKAKHVGYMMVQKIPEVLRSVLDKGILYDEQDSSILKLDFGWIINSAGVKVNPVSTMKSMDSLDDEKQELEGQAANNMRRRRETDLLIRMLRAHRSGREALLTHPWTEAFLHLKWLSIRKWFWIIRVIYGLLLTLYSFFIFNIYIWNCPPDDELESSTESMTMTSNSGPTISSEPTIIPIPIVTVTTTCETSDWISVMGFFIALGAFAMIFNEVYEFIQDRHVYVQTYLNILWWVLIICILCTLPPSFGIKPRQWQYPMAAFGLFFAWAMNLTQIGRIPSVGVYVEMLGKVLKDCVIFLITYASLLIAFTLGMCVMFPRNEYFKSVPLAFIKSLLMMIGENDYNDIFEGIGRVKYLEYSIPAHVMYAGFIFIVTIVMMNLLLGLAVSDIQELRKHSTVTRITRQITQIALVDSLFYSKCFPQRLASKFFPAFSADSHIERYFSFSPTDPDDLSLPDELKQKFVPYLTSSPCLNKQAVLRRVMAVNKWKATRRSSIRSSSAPQTPTKPGKESNPRKLLLQNLNDSVNEIKNQLRALSEKIERS